MPLVKLSNGRLFTANTGDSLVDAAFLAGITLPHSCKMGRCSTCKCKVKQGETFALQTETGLTDTEKANGWILSCVRTAQTDVALEVEDLGDLVLPPSRTLPCRISSLERLAADVIRVMLRLPPNANFKAIPGQYMLPSNGAADCQTRFAPVALRAIHCVCGVEFPGVATLTCRTPV